MDFLCGCCESLFGMFTPLEGGGKLKTTLIRFLETHSSESARAVYSAFLGIYRMPGLERLLTSMAAYEDKTARLLKRHRDHYTHSINTYILGLAVYVSHEPFRRIVDQGLKYPDAYQNSEEFIYRWGLTALFHDLGYPLEMCMKLANFLMA